MLSLSHREARNLAAFIEVLSAPLAFADSGSWRRAVMARGGALVSAERAVFGLGWEDGNPIEEEGQDPEATPAYIAYYHRLDRSDDERRRRRRAVFSVHHQLAEGWEVNPEFRHDFLGRFRLDRGAGMVHDVAAGVATWAGWYPDTETARRFGERVVPLFELALPAYRAGLDTLFRIRGLRNELAGLLDRVSDGFLLLDRQGRVVHQNAALQRMLAGDPESRSLEHVLRGIASRFSAGIRGVEQSSRLFRAVPVATHRAAYHLIPTLAGPELNDLDVGLIIQVVTRTAPSPPPDVLRAQFGLTGREADVARCLVQGLGYKRIAQHLGVSIDTVRAHIRSVYSKLQVHSMAEAVSRVLGDSSR